MTCAHQALCSRRASQRLAIETSIGAGLDLERYGAADDGLPGGTAA